MKKILAIAISASILLTGAASCKKERHILSQNQGTSSQTSSLKKAEVLQKIEAYRKTIKKKSKSFYPLGPVQKIVKYGGADVTGAVTTFKATAFTGSYAGAFAFLGAVVASTYAFADDHNDFMLAPPESNDDYETYSNIYEQAGYIHNQEVLKLSEFYPSTPDSPQQFLNTFYDSHCEGIAEALGLDPDTLKVKAPKSFFVNYLNNYGGARTTSQYIATMQAASVDSTIVNLFEDLFNDVSDPNVSELEEIITFIDLYISLVENDDTLSTTQREHLLYSLNIFKYSCGLWSVNVQE